MLALAAVLLAGCAVSPIATLPTGSTSAHPARDQLANILARGTLVGYAELDYPPQSIAVEGAARPADTRCAANQLTAPEVTGFDVETTKLVASELDVEACFVSVPYGEVTAGNWGGRMDVAFASGSINADRMTRLYMTQPYYATPNRYFVRADSPARTAAELSGKAIGTCAGCTHEAYLRQELEIPGVVLRVEVEDPEIVTYETERPGLMDVASGEIDAFLCAEPVGAALIEEGVALRALEDPAFTFFPSGFIDRSSGYEPTAFVARVTEIVRGLHADGRLKALSEEWFETDYTTQAAAFDLAAIGQTVP